MRLFTLTIVVASAFGWAAPARAQDPVSPYPATGGVMQGLFGGSRVPLQQSLTLVLSASGGIDDNVDPRANPNNPTPGLSSGFGQGSARLSYLLSRGNVGASGTLGGTLAHYTELAGGRVGRAHGDGRVWWQIPVTARTTFGVSATGHYQPYLIAGRFPIILDTSGQKALFSKIGASLFEEFGEIIDLGLGPTSAVIDPGAPTSITYHSAWHGRAQLSHQLTRRLMFSADYGYGGTDTSFDTATHRTQQASGALTYALTRDLGLRVGYGQTYHRSTFNGSVISHRTGRIDAGIQFHRALSITQSTTLAFGMNTNAHNQGGQTRYRLNGRLGLSQQISRSWQAHLDLVRDGEYAALFGQPVFSDALRTGVGGLLGTRVQLQAGLGVRRGFVGFNPAGNRFEAYFATTSAQVALSRYVAAGASYGYYRYDFNSSVPLPPGASSRVFRQSVQGFVNLWVPLLEQRRSS